MFVAADMTGVVGARTHSHLSLMYMYSDSTAPPLTSAVTADSAIDCHVYFIKSPDGVKKEKPFSLFQGH